MRKAKPCQTLMPSLSLSSHTRKQSRAGARHLNLLLELLTSRAPISGSLDHVTPGTELANLHVRETDVSLLSCNTQKGPNWELVQWEHELWIFHEYRGYFNLKYSQILHNFNLVAPLDGNIVLTARGEWKMGS